MTHPVPRRSKGALLVAILGVAFVPVVSFAQVRASDVFYLGADVSALAALRPPITPSDSATTSAAATARARRSAFVYRENGVESTEYAIMRKHGWNAFRVRVFVSPVRQAPNNSLENTIPLAKAIKDAGATLMLDIHYSDTWADPGHQDTPVAWRDLDADTMEQKVEEYTADVISQLKAAGAMPDMVQVGNEITGGFLWPLGHLHVPSSDVKQPGNEPMRGGFIEPYDEATVWSNVTRFLKAGIRGVKSASGTTQPKIILHTDTGGDWQVTKWWFDHITAANVDYDIMGLSFYPKYHGTLAKLQYMGDVVTTVQRNHGLGVFYWGPEGMWGDGMWSADGSAAPSIDVLNHLDELKAQPASRIPAAGQPRRASQQRRIASACQ